MSCTLAASSTPPRGRDCRAASSTSSRRCLPSIDLFALLNDPEMMLRGIDGMFTGLKDGLESKFATLALPLVGDKLKDAAKFVDNLRDSLLGVVPGQQGASVTALSRLQLRQPGDSALPTRWRRTTTTTHRTTSRYPTC